MNKKYKQFRFSSAFASPTFKATPVKVGGAFLRTCLNNNNAESVIYITRTPKWIYQFHLETVDDDGVLIPIEKITGDDLASAYTRKVRAINKFADYYEPLFKKRQVSLMFHTFTRVNYSRADMRRTLDAVKHRYKSISFPIRGYIWILEVSENLHIHYHLVVAIDRLYIWKQANIDPGGWLDPGTGKAKIHDSLKFEDIWKQATHVSFVKYSVRQYLKKYLSKTQVRVLGFRNYGISRKFL